jgi:hypothetical protein
MASATACCSVAPRPILPGSNEKNLIVRLAGLPGFAARSVLMMTMRSTCEASIVSSTVAMFADSSAERSWLVDVTPSAVSTASAPENAFLRSVQSVKDGTTAMREPPGTFAMRSGRERTMAVNPIPSVLHTSRIPCPKPPAAPITATWWGSGRIGSSANGVFIAPLVRRNAARRPGPVEGRWLRAKARRRYLHLTDLAAAGGGAVALIPAAGAAFALTGGLRVPAATLACRARAGCALTSFRFHRHWNLLFALSLVALTRANNWSVASGAPIGIV